MKALLRTCAQPNWVIDDAALNFGVQRGHVLVVKRDLATDEDIKYDTERPDVDLRASVHFGIEQFGCGKVERATKGGEVQSRVVEVRESKVDDFNVTRFRDEDVFNLEVWGG